MLNITTNDKKVQAQSEKRELAKRLQAEINRMQGLGNIRGEVKAGFAPFSSAFPGNVFPTGAIHEFISYEPADAASTSGFMAALGGLFMKDGGLCVWVGNGTKVFPSALSHFGLGPDRIVFINASAQRDLLWIIEETLKCEGITLVVGEIKELGFTESRRLQLAVERSGVTGLVHRHKPRSENAVACTSRWKITSRPSIVYDDLPGMGYSCWDVELLKVRNGRPGSWQIGWSGDGFVPAGRQPVADSSIFERQAG